MGSGVGVGVGAGAGIGVARSYYATPIELGLLPWTLDFTPDNAGAEPFPLLYLIDPYQDTNKPLKWTTADWDPALRFWSLPYDPQLTEWLQSVNPAAPSTLAAREFGTRPELWHPAQVDFMTWKWIQDPDVAWWPGDPRNTSAPIDPAKAPNSWNEIKTELEQLKIYMEDDRARYLIESDVQADGLSMYIIHFIGANSVRHPWTLELINCGLSIGNIAYMAYKAHFKRVRPSILRPGLIPPFGPPGHPAFPSGHSFLSHFIALLLLEIPGLHHRLGVLPPGQDPSQGVKLQPPVWSNLDGQAPIQSPLLNVARRIAVNRERIGVHYPSDSFASRHLAAGLWDATMPGRRGNGSFTGTPIHCPTLETVLAHAKEEWPTPW